MLFSIGFGIIHGLSIALEWEDNELLIDLLILRIVIGYHKFDNTSEDFEPDLTNQTDTSSEKDSASHD